MRRFSLQTINGKILALFSLTVILTGLIYISTTLYVRSNLKKDVKMMTSKTLDLYMQKLDLQLSDFKVFMSALTTSNEIQNPLKQQIISENSYDRLVTGNYLEEYLYTQQTSLDALTGIVVVANNGSLYTSGSSLKNNTEWKINSFVESSQGTKGELHWRRFFKDGSQYLVFFRIINTVNNNFTYEPIGTIIFYLNMDILANRDLFVDSFYNSSAVITDDNGEILYDSSRNFNDTSFLAQKNSFIIKKYSSKSQYSYYLILSSSEIFGQLDRKIQAGIFTFIVILLIICMVCYMISRDIRLPLNRLSMEMKRAGAGNFAIDELYILDVCKKDEIGEICRTFVTMIRQIKQLIDENYLAKVQYKDAQLKALQAQMNPHFLYNTLNNIVWLAKLQETDKIATLVNSLSSLLRAIMDHKTILGTLGEELQLVSHYITIQKIRFGNRLIYQERCDENLKSALIPRLLLQPFVENSVKYSIEPSSTPHIIIVCISKEKEQLQILISDDGPDPVLDEKNPENVITSVSGNGISMKNVEERLSLLYGERSSISVNHPNEIGTTIIIKIPLEEKANDKDHDC